ncbi:MAG: prepilin-type N-terminal cleavage/methylation domain-containing protein [Pseudomonadota bacterium]|nr:prepilin-type N-terminal cleavage/methylation domain-containing protein [Pseudomonadota bacterium]
MKTRHQQAGFTLIELVFVIVILGILAAFAVPRFVDLTGQARTASANALEGSLRSASALTHAVALATGQTGATGTVTADGGTTIDMVHGYPAGTATGIVAALQDLNGYTATANATTPPSVTIAVDGAPGACTITYEEPSAANDTPDITPALGGC